MKGFLVAVLLAALLPLTSFALCVSAVDNGCTVFSTASCVNPQCTSTTFVADATGTFDLTAKIECRAVNECQYCDSQVCLYETTGGTIIARINSNNATCTSCENRTRVDLRRGVSYTMVVCKTACAGHTCGDLAATQCHSDCLAVGIVNTPGVPCP